MIALRFVSGVTDHFAMRFPEWVGAAFLTQFSITLLVGQPFASNHAYDAMAAFASQHLWGAVVATVAALRVLALAINGLSNYTARRTPAIRAVAAGLSAGVWWAVAIAFFSGNAAGTGWGHYCILASGEMVYSWLIAKPAGKAWSLNARS